MKHLIATLAIFLMIVVSAAAQTREQPTQQLAPQPGTAGGGQTMDRLTTPQRVEEFAYCCNRCPGVGQGEGCQPAAGGPGTCPSGLSCFVNCTGGETVQNGTVTCH